MKKIHFLFFFPLVLLACNSQVPDEVPIPIEELDIIEVPEVFYDEGPISHFDFTFTWPEAWVVNGQLDENTWELVFDDGEEACLTYFSLTQHPDNDFKSGGFLNDDGSIEITLEGAGEGYNGAKAYYAYGLWVDDLMHLANFASPECDSYTARRVLDKEDVEGFLKSFFTQNSKTQ